MIIFSICVKNFMCIFYLSPATNGSKKSKEKDEEDCEEKDEEDGKEEDKKDSKEKDGKES